VAKLDKPTLAGLVFCALPVAAFSAFSQFETGRMAHIPGELAWVMPVATDAAAFVATRVWLDEKYSRGIRRYAAWIVIGCVLLSVAGAALHLGLSVPEGQPSKNVPDWLPFAVGAIPSLVLAALIHLGALIGATPEKHVKTSRATTPSPRKGGSPNVGTAEHRPPTSAVPTSKPKASPSAETAPELKTKPDGASSVTSTLQPEVGKGSTRDQMLAYLDKHGEVSGAELDRIFNTKDYGRGVLRTWRKRHPIAAGE